jgi:pantothenate kinase
VSSPSPRCDLDALRDRVRGLASAGRRAIIGITGAPGAGKSTLAQALVDAVGAVGAVAVPMDGFHLADVQLALLGLLDRKGAPETFDAAGYAALLARLRADDEDVVYAPGFERTLEQPIAGAVAIPRAARVVVTEGNYLLLATGEWPRARASLDEVWFCDADDAVRRKRLIARHVQFGKSPEEARAWVTRSDEPNAALVAGTLSAADLVVRSG